MRLQLSLQDLQEVRRQSIVTQAQIQAAGEAGARLIQGHHLAATTAHGAVVIVDTDQAVEHQNAVLHQQIAMLLVLLAEEGDFEAGAAIIQLDQRDGFTATALHETEIHHEPRQQLALAFRLQVRQPVAREAR